MIQFGRILICYDSVKKLRCYDPVRAFRDVMIQFDLGPDVMIQFGGGGQRQMNHNIRYDPNWIITFTRCDVMIQFRPFPDVMSQAHAACAYESGQHAASTYVRPGRCCKFRCGARWRRGA